MLLSNEKNLLILYSKQSNPFMKIKYFLLFVIAAVSLFSCGTSIKSDVWVKYPARAVDEVMICDVNDSVPKDVRIIGTVHIKDYKDVNNVDRFNNLIDSAVQIAANNGANVLYMEEHKYPSFMNQCHNIYGTMYLFHDSLITAEGIASKRVEFMDNENRLWYTASKQERNKTRAMNAANNYEVYLNGQLNLPDNVIKLNVGPSWITSDMFDAETGKKYKTQSGVEFGIQYAHLWKSGWGIGVNFSHFKTSFPRNTDVKMMFVGPSVVWSRMRTDKRRYDCSLALGYARYSEKYHGGVSDSQDMFGASVDLGIEYMISSHMGIGVQMTSLIMRKEKPEGVVLDKDESYGINRLNILGGLRFYF